MDKLYYTYIHVICRYTRSCISTFCVNDTVSREKMLSKCKAAELTSGIETLPEDNDIDGQHPTKRV